MTPVILTLFNALTDGIAIVGPDARVRFANESMQKLLPAQLGSAFPHAQIADAIDGALAGHLSLPHSFEAEIAYDLHVATPDALQVHLVRSPAGKDLVVVVTNLTEQRIYRATLDNLSWLIDKVLADPLEHFMSEFEQLLDDCIQPSSGNASLLARRDTLAARGAELIAQLRSLTELAQLGHARSIEADERIVLEHWLGELIARQEARASERGQRLLLSRSSTTLPAIYGSAHWLGRALDACLDNAMRHSPNGTDIVVSVLACGTFVRISIQNKGVGLQSPLLRRRLMQPLMRGAASNEVCPALGLGLPLARQIIELHRGRLALEQGLDGFITCNIELPAGASPHTPSALDIAQAQRYANDLVRLIAARQR